MSAFISFDLTGASSTRSGVDKSMPEPNSLARKCNAICIAMFERPHRRENLERMAIVEADRNGAERVAWNFIAAC
jgi:hypothetical protein